MKKIILVVILLFLASLAYCQCVIKDGVLVSYLFNPNEIELMDESVNIKSFYKDTLNILTIGSECFANKRCKKIMLPEFVVNFQKNVFYNTPNLKYILLNTFVQNIDDNTFTGSSLEHIEVMDMSSWKKDLIDFQKEWLAYKLGYGMTDNVSLALIALGYTLNSNYISFSEADKFIQIKYKSYDGVLYSRDLKLVCYPPLKKGEKYEIASNCKKLGDGAFRNCKYLKKLYIPISVSSFTKNTFQGSDDLVLVVINNSAAHKLCEKLHLKYEIKQKE